MARARTFSKNTANYMSLGGSGLGSLLNGLAVFSVAARIRLGAGLSGGVNDNNIVGVIASGTTGGFALSIDGTGTKLRCSSRSVSTDARQALTATTVLTTGIDYYVGVVVNIGAKTITLYVNGVSDGTVGGLAYANAVWTLGTPTDNDAIGGFQAPPPSTSVQFDGEISQVALWNTALTAGNFATVAAGTAADAVAAANLLWYLKIDGLSSPELPTVGTPQGTITGSLPVVGPVVARTISVGASRANTVAVGASRAVTVAVGANRATTVSVGASQ